MVDWNTPFHHLLCLYVNEVRTNMSYIHDIIKILYVREGYLPNYPYHLISDGEMAYAFLRYEGPSAQSSNISVQHTGYSSWEDLKDELRYYKGYFMDKYMNPYIKKIFDDLFPFDSDYLAAIVNFTQYLHQQCVEMNESTEEVTFPDWIYSYMIGRTFGPKSDFRDLHDLFVLLDQIGMLGTTIDNLDDEFTAAAGYGCYQVLRKTISKLPLEEQHPAGMFGEPAVIKYGRVWTTI